MESESQTQERIIVAALRCMSAQGIKKTSMEDVAQEAGVTRVTVYRYFGDKRELVRATFLHIEAIFQQADRDLAADPQPDIMQVLERIARDLSALPPGNPGARLDEFRRLYPDIYEEVQAFRLKVIGDLFDHLFGLGEVQGLLRPGLNPAFVQAIFWEAMEDIFENPNLRRLNLSNAEMFLQFSAVFLHGILKD